MDSHIFIDNSNIFGGAQRAAATIEPQAVWLAVRIYYRNFFQLLEKNTNPVSKVMAGSVPPGNEKLWNYARQQGYDTDLLRRVENDDGRLAEQGVDEIAHLKIANVLLDFDAPQTLVLVTGDGNDSDFGTSFTKQAERALKRGWTVQVWSWRDQLSGRFARLNGIGTGHLQINELDTYYYCTTFIQGGTYKISGSTVNVTGRVVSRPSF